jgi:hypothetical protein
VAYAGDVTLFLTSVADFQIVENAISIFEQASGARVNSHKSTSLPVRPWRSFDTIRGIEYRSKVEDTGYEYWELHKTISDRHVEPGDGASQNTS